MKTNIKYILISVVIFLLLVISYFVLTSGSSKINVSKTQTTTIINKTFFNQSSYVNINNFTYSIYFDNVNWSKYSTSSCSSSSVFSQNAVYCSNVTSLINTSTVKVMFYFKNNLNATLYLNKTPITSFNLNPSSIVNCTPSIIKPSSNFSCTITSENKGILPNMLLNNNFNLNYCYNSCNAAIYSSSVSYQVSATPSKNNIPFNYNYIVNITKVANTTYSYSGVFEVPINLVLENITTLTNGFSLKNTTPSLPINFTGGTGKQLHITLQLPNKSYNGSLKLKLVYSN